jgi:hypothetical protein
MLGKYGCPNCEGGLDDSDTLRDGLENCIAGRSTTWATYGSSVPCYSGWWEIEPDVGRVADELADQLDIIGANET